MTTRPWHVFFCAPTAVSCPAVSFIDGLRPSHQVKVLKFIELLEQMGPHLPRPYADILHDGIHELRLKIAGVQVRFLYFFCFERFIILFEAFHKHTERVPESVIRATLRYREKLIEKISPEELERLANEQSAAVY